MHALQIQDIKIETDADLDAAALKLAAPEAFADDGAWHAAMGLSAHRRGEV